MVKHILFACTENSARSQMAEAFFNYYNKSPEYKAISAGISPSNKINPSAVDVMKEKGINISGHGKKPKLLTPELANNADRIFTMGCIDSCPIIPNNKTQNWNLEDPSGSSVEKFRELRDEIESLVKELTDNL